MSLAKDFLETVKNYNYGTNKHIRDLEKKLGLPPKDLEEIPELYDYLEELIQLAKEKGISYKIGAKEI